MSPGPVRRIRSAKREARKEARNRARKKTTKVARKKPRKRARKKALERLRKESIAEPLADVGKIGPRPLSVVTLASMLPLLFVEVKQAYKVGLRSHLVSVWNVIAAIVLGSISVSIVLSEATNVAAASVIRVIHWYWFLESGSN